MDLALADQVAHRRALGTSTSQATTRPEPSAVGSSCWVMMPCSATDSCTRTWPCCWAGNTSMMRSIVCGGVLGVQGGEHEVAGLGRGQRGRDRLEVAHLADEDHVGVLAQRGLQRGGEALRVGAELALVDHALLVGVHELDRVLDRHDVLVARRVDLVDHRRERGRLARAGRAGDEHEAARPARELVDDGRQAELVDRGQPEGDQAEGGADRAALEVGVDTEAGVAGDRVGEVELPVGLQALALLAGEDRVDDLARVRRRTASGSPRAATSRPRTRTVGCAPGVRCRSDALRWTTSISRSAKSMSMVDLSAASAHAL